MKGKFIVIEGGEGSGKGTQIELLRNVLPADTVFTREPGGTEIGEKIRALILDKSSSRMSFMTELLLFSAARAQLMRDVIIPALKEGKNVVCDRFCLSTLAYQIYGRNRHDHLDFLLSVSDQVVGRHVPDLYLLIDVPPEIGLERAARRKEGNNRFDEDKIQFHRRVREGYLKEVKRFPHAIIDGAPDAETVHASIMRALAHVL